MSPLVDVNFEDVPDEVLPVGAGIYEATCEEVPTLQAPKENPERGNMVVAVHTISEGEFKGRKLTTYDCLWMDLGKISFKRLCLACGLTPGADGVDLADLVGKAHKIQVTERTYKDESDVERATSDIKDYVIE